MGAEHDCKLAFLGLGRWCKAVAEILAVYHNVQTESCLILHYCIISHCSQQKVVIT